MTADTTASRDLPALGDMDWFEVHATTDGLVLVCTRCHDVVCGVDDGDTISELVGMTVQHLPACERAS